jgi:CDP-glycerol glycerophosphotransferase (TagB/SpsB family)
VALTVFLLAKKVTMQIRQIALVAPSLTITQFELADVDVDIYIRHTRSMKPVNCVFVDNELVYPGMFDSESISKAKKKLKKLSLKEATNV